MTRQQRDPPDVPDQDWSNPFPEGFPLHELYGKRVRNDQDLVIVIDDYHARRGTGKTVSALQLANGMNQHGDLTQEHVTTKPEEFRNAYANLPERSAIVLDEGELGASKYDASSTTNRGLRQIMSIGRCLEKYVVVTMPDHGMLDPEVWKMTTCWVSMTEKGRGLLHFLKRNPYSGKIQTEKVGAIGFQDIERGTQLREVYNYLTEEKRGHISGEDAEEYLTQSEVDELLAEERESVRQATRNDLITSIYDHLRDLDDEDLAAVTRNSGVSQRLLAEAVGLSQPQIGNIVRDNES